MKAIMISIQPRYLKDILNGEKTLEIRKTFPKCDLPIVVYIYCTQGKPYIKECKGFRYIGDKEIANQGYYLNGKVVAKFTLNKVDIIKPNEYDYFYPNDKGVNKSLEDLSCLTKKELHSYLKGKRGYAWHIDNLVIFDKPKEISEFRAWQIGFTKNLPDDLVECDFCPYNNYYDCEECPKKFLMPLTRAPQSWQFIEV